VRAELPGLDQIDELDTQLSVRVPPEYIDRYGHMNVKYYLEISARAFDGILEEIGIDSAYRTERRMGVFAAEHHIRYLAELHEGSEISAHIRVLDRSDKAAHLMTFIVDRSNARLSSIVELILLHVDTERRRAVPFPLDIASELDRHIAKTQASWNAPTIGAMGVRR